MRILTSLLSLSLVVACGDSSEAPIDGPRPDVPPITPDGAPDAAVPTPDDFTAEELALLGTLTPLGAVPADPTNAFADDPKAAALGQMLFFDKSYSGALIVGDNGTNGGLGMVGETGKVACASCHTVGGTALDDQRTRPNNVSLGTNLMTRNAHGLVNSSFFKWANWGGRFDSQWALPLAVAENANIMRSTRLQLAHMLFAKYRTEYNATFPVALDPALDPNAADAARFPPSGKPKANAADPDGAFELMAPGDRAIVNAIFVNYGKALAAYTRTLVSRNAAFDRYVAGDKTAISTAAKRGLHSFLARCTGCHTGSNFSDDDFHALGVPQTGPGVPATDLGRFQDVPPLLASPFNSNGAFSDNITTGRLTGLVQVDTQKGQFRTKGLRNVATSAPYMHAGQFALLEDVVAFYNAGGGDVGTSGIVKDPRIVPLDMTATEVTDLAEFLRTLTGEPVPTPRLVDTSK